VFRSHAPGALSYRCPSGAVYVVLSLSPRASSTGLIKGRKPILRMIRNRKHKISQQNGLKEYYEKKKAVYTGRSRCTDHNFVPAHSPSKCAACNVI